MAFVMVTRKVFIPFTNKRDHNRTIQQLQFNNFSFELFFSFQGNRIVEFYRYSTNKEDLKKTQFDEFMKTSSPAIYIFLTFQVTSR